jgi:hypothetical protein
MSSNMLVVLPSESFSRLTSLTEVRFSAAPPSLRLGSSPHFARSWQLDLRDNQLCMLPAGLPQLTALKKLVVTNNDTLVIPPEAYREGPFAVFAYLFTSKSSTNEFQ